MMTAVETKVRRALGILGSHTRLRRAAEAAAWSGGGFLLSAAALGGVFQPIALGLICCRWGWRSAAAALGSILGYRLFWGQAGIQGAVWAALAWVATVILGRERQREEMPLLLPVAAAFLVSGTGLAFQIVLKDPTGAPVYLLRILLAASAVGLFSFVARNRESPLRWAAEGAVVLALAQIAPAPWLSLGYFAAGWLGAGGEFPTAALTGAALDLAGVTPVPMTVVLSLGYLVGHLPWRSLWLRCAAPAAVYCVVMAACNVWDPMPLPGLVAGGLLTAVLPPVPSGAGRRGRTGTAQVRLEMMAGVMDQSRQLMMEAGFAPIDREALALRVKERACGGCPNRKQCRDVEVPAELLSRRFADTSGLGIPCKKPGRMAQELRRGQEQLRFLQADRDRQREYREAAAQQYGFLSGYLRQQADLLARRGGGLRPRLKPEVGVCSAGKELSNGDLCLHFSGTECRYYVMLCDGMGTGLGAAWEGQSAAGMLEQMLTAGFPAEHALRSLNSLLALTGKAGAVTVDLAELRLDTGRVTLYKWGAAPSYLLRTTGAEKIGTAGPPPGLSVTETRETVDRLSLRRGEALILLSDGVDALRALRREGVSPESPPGELAAELLEGAGAGGDDATAVVIRLLPAALPTS